MIKQILISTLLMIFIVSCGKQETADVIYKNGKIYTVDENQPWAEAVAIKDGKFFKVGSNDDVEGLAGENTEVVDLDGRFVMPGINDLHHHGMDLSIVETNPNQFAIPDDRKSNPEDIVEAIKEFAEAHPELPYIYAEDFPDGMFPGNNGPKELLDEADPNRPIMVLSSGGHAHWGNSKALETAGITADTPDPEYGIITRKSGSKEPTGGLQESAMQYFIALMDKPSRENIRAGFKHHTARINTLGITAVRIAGVMQDHLEVASELDKAGELNAYHSLAFHWRTSYIARKEKDPELIKKQILNSKRFETENVASGVLKYYADGAPASKTAYLLEDYENDPGNKGKFQMDVSLFKEEISFWTKNGITSMTHVIGDAASRVVVDAIEEAQIKHGMNNVRHHITHTVMMDPSDIRRLKALDVVVDVSPCVAAPMSFHNSYKHHFGKRHEQFFPARALFDSETNLMLASDFPVGPDNPWVNMEVWVTRMNPYGKEEGTLGEHSAVTLKEAIYASTLAGAYGLYKENELGSLETGKRATFIVLNQNLFEIPAANLSETKVEMTVFNGRVVYKK